jgi:hypothetical protein
MKRWQFIATMIGAPVVALGAKKALDKKAKDKAIEKGIIECYMEFYHPDFKPFPENMTATECAYLQSNPPWVLKNGSTITFAPSKGLNIVGGGR